MSDTDIASEKLKAAGATPEQIESYRRFAEQLEKLKAAKGAADAVADLQKQIAQFGLSDAEKKAQDMAAAGIDPKVIDEYRRSAEHLEALNKAKQKSQELDAKAKSVTEEMLTPMEKYQKKADELNELLKSHRISAETYNRAMAKADAELNGGDKHPELLRGGSAQAQALAYDLSRGSKATSVDYAQQQVKKQEEANTILGDVRDILQQSKNPSVIDIGVA